MNPKYLQQFLPIFASISFVLITFFTINGSLANGAQKQQKLSPGYENYDDQFHSEEQTFFNLMQRLKLHFLTNGQPSALVWWPNFQLADDANLVWKDIKRGDGGFQTKKRGANAYHWG